MTLIEDIPYGDHERCRMDLYVPSEGEANGAAVLLIHGGGWSKGDKEAWRPLAEMLAAQGYVCASAGYRVAPDNVFPAHIEDVRAAMAAFKDMADAHGFDPDRVGAVGSSAGGHLAALLAALGPEDGLGVTDDLSRKDTRPAAVALYNPIVDFTHDVEWANRWSLVFGVSIEDDRALYEAASPVLHVDEAYPPTLFLYGTDDTLTPVTSAFPMANRLHELGIPCEVTLFFNMWHGFGYHLHNEEQRRAARMVCDFFDQYLVVRGNRPPTPAKPIPADK